MTTRAHVSSLLNPELFENGGTYFHILLRSEAGTLSLLHKKDQTAAPERTGIRTDWDETAFHCSTCGEEITTAVLYLNPLEGIMTEENNTEDRPIPATPDWEGQYNKLLADMRATVTYYRHRSTNTVATSDVAAYLESVLPAFEPKMMGKWATHLKYGTVLITNREPDEDGDYRIMHYQHGFSEEEWVPAFSVKDIRETPAPTPSNFDLF